MGIKESKELLTFLARLGNSIDKALEDNKITVSDASYLFDPIFAAKGAFEGVNLIPAELSDLDNDEALELVFTVKTELDLRDDQGEELTEEGLALAIQLVSYINKIRAARNTA